MTLRRPSTAECSGVKAEDTCDIICRIGTRAEGPGAMMGPWDVVWDGDLLPEGTEEGIVEGKGECQEL